MKLSPDDAYNQTLVSNVHPPTWQNPTAEGTYNLVVVGGGTAGLVTASAAAQMGAKVALVERHLLGGDCLNVGCVPSKGIIRAARAAAAIREAKRFGVLADAPQIDFAAAMERMRKLRASISYHDAASRFRDLGVEVYFGEGHFESQNSFAVAGQRLRFRKAVIATGARAAVPEIPGIGSVPFYTNENIFSLIELPTRLGVIGAGPIGCEMAQTFARLGSQVTLIDRNEEILGKEDADAAAIVRQRLESDGVQVYLNASGLKLEQSDGTVLSFQVKEESSSRRITVDALLASAGRAPNVESLNLDAAGVRYDTRRGVEVDDRLRTSNRNIFAAGDVCSRFQFTHAADFMARTVLRNALFMGRSKQSKLVIPWSTYTSPEIASVGLTTAAAKEQSVEIDTYEQPLDGVDRAILDGDDEGFVRIHVRKGTDQIVGATIVAEHAGDMISTITLAMTHGLGLKQIANTIFPYPTQSEAVRKVGDQYNRTRLTPLVKSLFRRWLAWWR